DDVWEIGMNRAVEVIASKPKRGQRGQAATPVRELGEHPEAGGPINVFKGKYGPYVKWEKINATIPDTVEIDDLTVAQAVDLIAERAAKSGKKVTKKKAPAKKKKAAAKKA
ncbi:MAG: topoisomerase C-terminal repeat-containing protein, partial [Pseudomonadota bacterium]